MQRTRIKICGISTPETAQLLAGLGADAIGFIFHPDSPRDVSPEKVRSIISGLPAFVNKTGVFVKQSPKEIMEIVGNTGLDTIQLHGDQGQVFVDELRTMTRLPILLVRRLDRLGSTHIRTLTETGVNSFLIDKFDPNEYGGTGKTLQLDPDLSKTDRDFIRKKVVLSGGISISNVEEILKAIHPWGLDVSSSLEKEKGIKDPDLIREFMNKIKSIT
jgi:phosphoribosylanthranilate isomerase